MLDEETMEIGTITNPTVAKLAIPSSKMPMYVPGIQTGLENACRALLSEKSTVFQDPTDLSRTLLLT